jgi:hypothetical protein
MDDDLARLDDATVLLMRQAAADSGDAERQAALDAEVTRRVAVLRAQLGADGDHRTVLASRGRRSGGPCGRHQGSERA